MKFHLSHTWPGLSGKNDSYESLMPKESFLWNFQLFTISFSVACGTMPCVEVVRLQHYYWSNIFWIID